MRKYVTKRLAVPVQYVMNSIKGKREQKDKN